MSAGTVWQSVWCSLLDGAWFPLKAEANRAVGLRLALLSPASSM